METVDNGYLVGNISYDGESEISEFDETNYKPVVDRYYTKRYKCDQINSEDICILEHSNRICLVTLAPSHPIIKEKKTVVEVNFKIDDNVNRQENKVSGRLKRGAQWLNTTAVLCRIRCSDGSLYSIIPGMKANLIEINDKLASDPNLVAFRPTSTGYIAILLPKFEEHSKEMTKLTTENSYINSRAGQLIKTDDVTSHKEGIVELL